MKDKLAGIFAVSADSVGVLSPLSDGISNASYRFRIGADSYVVRVSEGDAAGQREKLESELRIYRELKRHGVRGTDELVYFNVDEGIKITRYIKNARYPDISDPADVVRCVALLKNVHDSGIVVDAAFDLMELFLREEEIVRVKTTPARHMPGYEEARVAAVALYGEFDDVFPHRFNHIDPIKYNFLFTPEQDYIIDFEYSCMASPMIDLAAFVVYGRLSPPFADGLLRAYLGRCPSAVEKRSLYRYLALEGLYAALWYLERLNDGAKMKRNMDSCYGCAAAYAKEAKRVH
jgi:thiamine kinase-like enzyme